MGLCDICDLHDLLHVPTLISDAASLNEAIDRFSSHTEAAHSHSLHVGLESGVTDFDDDAVPDATSLHSQFNTEQNLHRTGEVKPQRVSLNGSPNLEQCILGITQLTDLDTDIRCCSEFPFCSCELTSTVTPDVSDRTSLYHEIHSTSPTLTRRVIGGAYGCFMRLNRTALERSNNYFGLIGFTRHAHEVWSRLLPEHRHLYADWALLSN